MNRQYFLKDIFIIFFLGGAAIYLKSELLFIFGFGIWILTHFTRPVRFFYIFVLFYPFAFLEYSKLGIGPLELGFDDILLIVMIISIFAGKVVTERVLALEEEYPVPAEVKVNAYLVVLFSGGVLLSSLVVGDPISGWFTSVGYVLSFVVTIMLVRDPGVFSTVIGLLKVAAFILVLSAILSAYGFLDSFEFVDYFNMKPSYYRSFLGAKYASTGLVQSRGGFGVNIAFILPFVIQYLITNRGGLKAEGTGSILGYAFNVCLLGALIFAVIISGSRSTWLMAIVVITAFPIYKTMKNPIVVIGFFVPAAITLYILLEGSIMHLFHVARDISPESVESRMFMNRVALDIFLENPIFGLGRGDIVYKGGLNIDIHNFFLAIAAKNGLFGIVPILLLFLGTLRILLRISRNSPAEAGRYDICLVSGFAGMMVELIFYAGGDKQIWLYLGLISSFYAGMMSKNVGRLNDEKKAPRAA